MVAHYRAKLVVLELIDKRDPLSYRREGEFYFEFKLFFMLFLELFRYQFLVKSE